MPAPKPIGTRRVEPDGYVVVKVAERPAVWVFEHRLVWEQANGPIPVGYVVHHRNEVKGDNRLENLMLLASNSEHMKEHAEENRARGRHVGATNRGRPKSPEHRAKIAAALKGKEFSAVHRQRLSVAIRRAHAEGRLKPPPTS